MKRLALILGTASILIALDAQAAQDVFNTRHNLSTEAPVGVTRTFASTATEQVCIYCHTPHNALPDAQLWNHTPSTATYTLYGSTTLKTTTVGQPTGKSRLCLACHDGTVALGDLERPQTGVTDNLASVMMTGRANLSTDLSNDHPISFAYNAALLGLNPELADPASTGLPLEGDQLQCTTCHDPHEADVKPFLRLTTVDGTLCTTCHQRADAWPTSTHATSTAGVAATDLPWRRAEWVAPTVAGNACLACHTPHNANFSPERLIAQSPTQFNGVPCLDCHDGTPAADIATDFNTAGNTAHPVGATSLHDATKLEDPLTMALHVECMDCHNPHTVAPGALPMISFDPTNITAPHSTPPLANALIEGVTGIDLNGNPTTSVTNQYELCFKCHGRPSGVGPCETGPNNRCSASATFTRKDGVYNIRDKIHNVPAGGSWHPLITNNPANNGNVPSLRTDTLNTITSLIYCTDCHNSDRSPVGGGTGPYGPHGSVNPGLLANTYELSSSANGDAATSQLCFNCHDEATITTSTTTGFTKHGAHLGNRQGTCMKCHDPHGSNINARLINFLTTDGGAEIIGTVNSKGQPVPGSPYWADTGDAPDTGECWLTCHGTGHSGKTY